VPDPSDDSQRLSRQVGRDNLLDNTIGGAIGRTSSDRKASGEVYTVSRGRRHCTRVSIQTRRQTRFSEIADVFRMRLVLEARGRRPAVLEHQPDA
jgi:hypothetical protein